MNQGLSFDGNEMAYTMLLARVSARSVEDKCGCADRGGERRRRSAGVALVSVAAECARAPPFCGNNNVKIIRL